MIMNFIAILSITLLVSCSKKDQQQGIVYPAKKEVSSLRKDGEVRVLKAALTELEEEMIKLHSMTVNDIKDELVEIMPLLNKSQDNLEKLKLYKDIVKMSNIYYSSALSLKKHFGDLFELVEFKEMFSRELEKRDIVLEAEKLAEQMLKKKKDRD